MPYNYWWKIDKHILYLSFSGDMSEDEFSQAMQEVMAEIVLNGGPFVNVISDVRNIKRQLPVNEMIRVVRRLKAPEQMGWSVTVGNSNPLMRFLGTVAGQILGQRMRTFDTPEEAMAFLWEIDPNLTPDAADE